MKFIARLVEVITWSISILLVLRFALLFFGANPLTPFVQWLYEITAMFMGPFAGIFPTVDLVGRSVVDIPALVSAGIYFIVGFLIAKVLNSFGDNVKIKGGSSAPQPTQMTNTPSMNAVSQDQMNQPSMQPPVQQPPAQQQQVPQQQVQ